LSNTILKTAVGKHPSRAVQVLSEIATNADAYYPSFGNVEIDSYEHSIPQDVSVASCLAAATIAKKHEKIKFICCMTASGTSAVQLSQYKPQQPVIALTPYEHVYNRLAMAWVCFNYV